MPEIQAPFVSSTAPANISSNPDPVQRSDENFNASLEGQKFNQQSNPFPGTYGSDRVNERLDNLSNSTASPYDFAKSFSYGADYKTGNFERYYTHPLYNKLGYSPFRDNEKIYNEASTGFEDFQRMSHQWGGLAWTGFKDMYQEIFDPISISADLENSEDMNKRMSIGTSSKPGFSGGLTNFALNTAYTAGIMGEFMTEQAVLWGLSALAAPFTEGTSVLGAAAETGASIGRGIRNIGKGVSAMSKATEALSAIRSYEDAKKLFDLSKLGTKTVDIARGFGKFLNPFENLTDIYRSARSGEAAFEIGSGEARAVKAWDELKALGKAQRTAGALWRDLSAIRAVKSEARLEGGSNYTKIREDLFRQFQDEHPGQEMTADQAKDIEERAKAGSFVDTMGNIPLIYLTNKIVFDTMFKGFKPLRGVFNEPGKAIEGQIVGKIGAEEIVPRLSWRGATTALKPVNLFKHGFKYTLANLAEGIQETAQDALSSATADYYEQANLDPSVQGHKSGLVSLSKGIGTQLSGQGIETFLSGFLMGGALQGPQKVFSALPRAIYKITSPNKYAEYKRQSEEWKNQVINARNEVNLKPLLAINTLDRNFVFQKSNYEKIKDHLEKDDIKSAKDAQDQAMFHHVYTLLKAGQIDVLKNQINELNKSDDKGLIDAFDLNDASETDKKNVRSKLNGLTSRIDDIQKHFNYVDENFKNPYKEGTPVHDLVEHAKMIATFSYHDFDRTLQRMNDIGNSISQDKPLSKASFTDFSLLFNTDELRQEINLLKQEIPEFKDVTDPEGKRVYREKQERYEALKELNNATVNYKKTIKDSSKEISSTGKTDKSLENTTREYYKAYKSYLETIADQTGEHLLEKNIQDSFSKLKDYHVLDYDTSIASAAISRLINPEFLKGYVERGIKIHLRDAAKEEVQIKQALDEFLKRKENNDLYNALHDIGIFMRPSDAVGLFEKGILPTTFYDENTQETIKPESEKFKQIQGIIVQYQEITKPKEPEVKVEPIKTEEVKITQFTPIDQMPKPLLDELKAAYSKYVKSLDPDMDPAAFDGWIKGTIAAENIINKYTGTITTKVPEVTKVTEVPVVPEVIKEDELSDLIEGKPISNERLRDIAEKIFTDRKLSQGEKDIYRVKFPLIDNIVEGIKVLSSVPDTQDKTNTEDTRKILDFFAKVTDSTPYSGTLETNDYISYLRSRGELGDKVANLLNAPKEAVNTILNSEQYKTLITDVETPKETIPEIVSEVVEVKEPVKSAQERINETTNMDELDLVEGQFMDALEDNSPLVSELNLATIDLDTMIKSKRRELALKIDFNKIRVGEVLIMRDKERYGPNGFATVIHKDSNEIVLVRTDDESRNQTIIPKSEIINHVALQYNPGIEKVDLTPEPTEAEKELIRESLANISKVEDDPEVKKIIEAARQKYKEETGEDPLDSEC